MRWDLLVRGGTVVTAAGPVRADLAAADGVIAEIAPELSGGATEELDATGCHVLPGVIDTHVHFNDPGRADWEGVATGSAALAAGGGTLYCDMPLNASPPTLDAASFAAKLAASTGVARTDFAFWGGIVPGNLSQLESLAACGVMGFKAFMSSSGIDDFAASDDATLWAGMRAAAALGLPVAVHAENDAITAELARAAVAAGRTGVRDYLRSRPVVAEVEAIRRAICLAEDAGASLHIVHVTCGAGVAAVAEARARGVDVTCETCPHYLLLTEDDCARLGAVAKCAPPLRTAAEQAALWAGLADGRIAFVASDHSPAPAALKRFPTPAAALPAASHPDAAQDHGNFFAAWGGIAGVQTTLGLMLEAGHAARGLPLERLAELLAAAPARRYRLGHRGRLEPGWAADLAVVDLTVVAPLDPATLRDRHRLSPYVGRPLRGRLAATVLRGRTICRAGAPVGPPDGRLVRPDRPRGSGTP
jgi:allantoinase